MSDFDPAAAARLRAMLEIVPELTRRRVAAIQAEPAAGSLAAADEALPDARLVTIYAGQALTMAIDHLSAWRLLINGPEVPIRAHLTLLRAALEGAVRCRWHVDPTVDSGTRVGRGFAERRDDQRERRNFETSAEGGTKPATRGMTGAQRLAALDDPAAVAEREAAGVRSVAYAGTTSLMTAYGLEPWFRLASGLAHGKEWTLAATRLEPTPGQPPGSKLRSGVFSASETVAVAMTTVALDAIGQALGELEAYRSAPVDPSAEATRDG